MKLVKSDQALKGYRVRVRVFFFFASLQPRLKTKDLKMGNTLDLQVFKVCVNNKELSKHNKHHACFHFLKLGYQSAHFLFSRCRSAALDRLNCISVISRNPKPCWINSAAVLSVSSLLSSPCPVVTFPLCPSVFLQGWEGIRGRWKTLR